MDFERITVTGVVSVETRDQGSKSERNALLLKTDAGETHVLRNNDAQSFGDHSMDPLVGKTIITEGLANGSTLIVQSVQVLDP